MYVYPFKLAKSNRVELMSLAFLCILATMNLIRANFVVSGILVSGPTLQIIEIFKLIEYLFLMFLIVFIIFSHIPTGRKANA